MLPNHKSNKAEDIKQVTDISTEKK